MVKLVLIRHGQSIWNEENRFTGWIDVSLSKKGLKEAKKSGKFLKNYKFDLAFTSNLIRAQETLQLILNENSFCLKYIGEHREEKINSNWYGKFTKIKSDEKVLIIKFSSNLNERYYGDLQGLNKADTIKKYGKEKVFQWRRSYDIAPPKGESLKDTCARSIPYFKKEILPLIKQGKKIIISAHGNSLRSIIMFLENLSKEKILNVEIPTGVPLVYNLKVEDKNKIKIISKKFLK